MEPKPYLKRPLVVPIPILPTPRQAHCRQDQSGHRVGLRKISAKLTTLQMNILREKSVAVAIAQRIVKHIDGFLAATELPPHVNQPEPTDQKRGFRQAEIVFPGVTHNVLATQKRS